MKDGIRIEVVWFDNDVIAFQVDGSNERFAGSVGLYASHDSSQLAKTIRGFPASTMDVREFELGTFDETYAGGRVRMQFLSTDNVGHAAVKMIMRADLRMSNGQTETAVFQVGLEPVEIDNFVAQLDSMTVEVDSVACLRRVA